VSRGRTLDEFLDALAVLDRLALSHQIHLVLQDDNVLWVDADDLERGQVFSCLRLGARLVTGNQQQRSVHWKVSAASPNGRHRSTY
jgi:hypothetical protein